MSDLATPTPAPAARRTERDYLPTLARGLTVLRAFTDQQERLTLSDVARTADLPRATARRCLLTLATLGYVTTEGRYFRVSPQVLVLAQAYLTSSALPRIVEPFLERLSEELRESCSASVLQGADVIYIARSQRRRMASLHRNVGTHLPAHATSMGRVLLAGLSDAALDAWLATTRLESFTAATTTDPANLREKVMQARRDGYVVLQDELEPGLIGIAVPLRDAGGRTIAALNIGTQSGRLDATRARNEIVPALAALAADIRPLLVG